MLSTSGNRKFSSRHASARKTSAFNCIALALRMDLIVVTSASVLTAKIAVTELRCSFLALRLRWTKSLAVMHLRHHFCLTRKRKKYQLDDIEAQ